MTLIRDCDASKGSVVIGSLGTEVTTGLVIVGGIFDSTVEWFFSIVARSDYCECQQSVPNYGEKPLNSAVENFLYGNKARSQVNQSPRCLSRHRHRYRGLN